MNRKRIAGAGLVWLIVITGVAAVAGAGYPMAAPIPTGIPWQVTIVPAGEPGRPLVVTGTVYDADGVTPMPGVVIEVHQTDAEGYYSRQQGAGDTPRLKGRLRTSPQGRYELRTIKPGSYPGTRIPAHIHAKLLAPGLPETWIDEFWFEGDPFITPETAAKEASKGKFSAVMRCSEGSEGVLRCARDIRLERRPAR